MYMKIKQLIKMVKADAKKFLKSKDGKNYVKLRKNDILNNNNVSPSFRRWILSIREAVQDGILESKNSKKGVN
jgi:hypothetical protein